MGLVGGTKNIQTRSVINRTKMDNPKKPKLIVNINILKYISISVINSIFVVI